MDPKFKLWYVAAYNLQTYHCRAHFVSTLVYPLGPHAVRSQYHNLILIQRRSVSENANSSIECWTDKHVISAEVVPSREQRPDAMDDAHPESDVYAGAHAQRATYLKALIPDLLKIPAEDICCSTRFQSGFCTACCTCLGCTSWQTLRPR